MKKIYLDNASTTRVSKEVVKEIAKYFTYEYGNPGSLHYMGESALKAINSVRVKIAREIGAKPSEIYFTSGATESNNLALKGYGKKIVISSIEHPSVRECANVLGYSEINVDEGGLIDFRELEKKAKGFVSVIHANNIIGVVQDLKKIGIICKRKRIIFHTDATQSFGKLRINVREMNIDLLSASAHKIGGPKGVGFLYVRERIKLKPLIHGGGQERGLRSGTENVPGIMGFGKALEIIKKVDSSKIKRQRDYLIEELEKLGGKINGSVTNRLYNNIHVSFNVNAENLIYYLSNKGIYVSAGSACDSKKEKEDHVLKAINLKKAEIDGSIRISLSDDLKNSDLKRVVKEIRDYLRKV